MAKLTAIEKLMTLSPKTRIALLETVKQRRLEEREMLKIQALIETIGDISGVSFGNNITQEHEEKQMSVVAGVFNAAFNLGYYEFKDAARFVLFTIEDMLGADFAESITINQLQGAYIGMSSRDGEKASSKLDVINVESIKDLYD